MDNEKMEYIHMLLVNGEKKEMAKEINMWGNTFWEDYLHYLDPLYWAPSAIHNYFSQAIISYHRLSNYDSNKPFNEDFNRKIPLNEVDFIEMDPTMTKYQIHLLNPEDRSFKVIREYRGTKGIKFHKDHLEIR